MQMKSRYFLNFYEKKFFVPSAEGPQHLGGPGAAHTLHHCSYATASAVTGFWRISDQAIVAAFFRDHTDTEHWVYD